MRIPKVVVPRRAVAALCAGAFVLVLLVEVLTIRVSPPVWQDEVQIVDLGRTALAHGRSDWSMSWLPDAGRPVAFLNYLGPIGQEFFFRIFAPSVLGPRISSFIAACLASVLLFAWLSLRRIPRPIAGIVSFAFLADPMFVASYRGARVDSWIFAISFCVCYLLRSAAELESTPKATAWKMFAAGCLVVGGLFVWPSMFFLIPLVIVEGITLASAVGKVRFFRSLRWSAWGCMAALLVAVVPLWKQRAQILADLVVSKNSYVANGNVLFSTVQNLFAAVLTLKLTPILAVLALASAFVRRNRLLVIALAFTTLCMLRTQVYHNRILYLIPYMVVLVAEGLTFASARWRGRRSSYLVTAGIIMLLGWSAGLSLFARPVLAWTQRKGRDPDLLVSAADKLVGKGPLKVYLPRWEFYYAGRFLGWKMYREYGKTPEEQIRHLLGEVDAAVVSPTEAGELANLLEESGLRNRREVQVGPPSTGRLTGLAGAPFGTYFSYSRARSP